MGDSRDLDEVFSKNTEHKYKNESEKENLAKAKCVRTKKQQFDLIVEFYKENNEKLLDSNTYNQRWIILTEKLNSIGPPNHSSIEWKRVWSEHKYNKKRKRSYSEDQHNLTIQQQSNPPLSEILLNVSMLSDVYDQTYQTNQQIDFPNDTLMHDRPLFPTAYDQPYHTNHSNQKIGALNDTFISDQQSYSNQPLGVENVLVYDHGPSSSIQQVNIPKNLISKENDLFLYDQSYDTNQQIGAQNDKLINDQTSHSKQPSGVHDHPSSHSIQQVRLPENSISNDNVSFVYDQQTHEKTWNKLSEINKKMDLVVDLLIESNNLTREMLAKF